MKFFKFALIFGALITVRATPKIEMCKKIGASCNSSLECCGASTTCFLKSCKENEPSAFTKPSQQLDGIQVVIDDFQTRTSNVSHQANTNGTQISPSTSTLTPTNSSNDNANVSIRPPAEVHNDTGTDSIEWSKHPNYHLLPNSTNCGRTSRNHSRVRRVVGGIPASKAQFPWMVKLFVYNVSGDVQKYQCGGSLINSRYVLTAAHCVARLSAGEALTKVSFGDYLFSEFANTTQRPCSSVNITNKLTLGEPCFESIEEVIIHENYTRSILEQDIALIRLANPLDLEELDASVNPICLPSRKEEIGKDNPIVHVAGWGRIDSYFDTNIVKPVAMNMVKLRLVPKEYCDFFHSTEAGRLREDRICVLGGDGRSVCNGDSGSPVSQVQVMDNGDERTVELGIVSYGDNYCGLQGSPVILVNVVEFIPWILDTIRE